MKMGDSLLFIYLLSLYFTRARTSVFLVMLTPGHGKGGGGISSHFYFRARPAFVFPSVLMVPVLPPPH